MSKRFYVEPGTLSGDVVSLVPPLTHRLAKVLRLHAGDEVMLFDGSGEDARVVLDLLNDRAAEGRIGERVPGIEEPPTRVTLYQSITKGERFEWLLEKATELGVSCFVPLITARAVVKTAAEGNRAERWRRIVLEAAEQCGRSIVPEVKPPARFDEALASAEGLLVVPYEAAAAGERTVRQALAAEVDALFALGAVSIFIGPEGGFEHREVDEAIAAGALIVTMGPRVLRSETAGLVAATLALEATGALGS
jgi:16S rRNA (uracil1498-N3)-methyltransferase